MPRQKEFRKIHYGYYEIARDGEIRRVKRAQGTYPGKSLQPYHDQYHDAARVKLHREGEATQIKISTLLRRAFG